MSITVDGDYSESFSMTGLTATSDTSKRKRSARRAGAPNLEGLADQIAWDRLAAELSAGDLSSLEADIAAQIRQAAAVGRVRKTAKRLGLSPEKVVIGLLARSIASANRYAARVERALLSQIDDAALEPLRVLLGLAQDMAAVPATEGA